MSGSSISLPALIPFGRSRLSGDPLKITNIISAKSRPLQSPLPSLDLSSRCSNLSRALSPKHANKLTRLYLKNSFFNSLKN
jgi:hypothetical protein